MILFIRQIIRAFVQSVSGRNYNGLQTREYFQYPSWHQHQVNFQ